MDTLDLLTAIALCALSVDVGLQIWRVMKMKSSEDVSISGVIIRFIAALVMLVKFAWIQDAVLVWGQVILVIVLTYYLFLLVKLRPRTARKKVH